MGSGSYSYSAYASLASDRDLLNKSRDEIFENKTILASNSVRSFKSEARQFNQVKAEMLSVGVRECRDSEEHPQSTPIIIALDVTGSMLDIPHKMITEQLPFIMGKIQQMGIPDPQLLFMAVGDHEWDRYPIQIGQFESDTTKIVDMLQSFVLEGGGGGNRGESYCLAHLIAGFHTETDSWFKRNTKGFLFTIGDEPNLPRIDANYLVGGLGYQNGISDITAAEALTKAKEQYNVFHIHVSDASHRLDQGWQQLLGDNLLTCKSDDVSKVIVQAIKDNYSGDVAAHTEPETESEKPEETKEEKFY